jgi:uncharacterized protein YndB with AHSA1/START domain
MAADGSSAAEREIVITRLVDAPRDLVYKVWTDPEHVVHWWGPNGFTNTIHHMDVRPGGEWRLTMHGPDGTDYRNLFVFVEVDPPARVVYDHVSGPKFRGVMTFEEEGARTRVTLRSTFETAELRNYTVETFGAIEGGKQTLARLDDYVSKMKVMKS